MKRVFTLILVLTGFLYGSDYENGNIAFSKGVFKEAKSYYLLDLDKRGESFNTYYNLSKVTKELKESGYRKYYLLKAREISPRNRELRRELKDIGLKPEVISFRESITLLSIALLLLSITILYRSLSTILPLRKISNTPILFTFIPLILLLSLGVFFTYKGNKGVILVNQNPKISPYIDSDDSFTATPGNIIKIDGEFKEFYKIDDNGKTGWITKESVGLLWKR